MVEVNYRMTNLVYEVSKIVKFTESKSRMMVASR